MLLLSRGRRRRALGLSILLFALRLQDFTSMILCLLRSARVCKRTPKPSADSKRGRERTPRTVDGGFVASDLMSPQLVMSSFTRGRGIPRFAQCAETFRRVLFSFGGRVRVRNGGFQPANHVALVFICATRTDVNRTSSAFAVLVGVEKKNGEKRTAVRHVLNDLGLDSEVRVRRKNEYAGKGIGDPSFIRL